MLQLQHRLALNLTDPLAGHVELLADLFKRVIRKQSFIGVYQMAG